MIKICLDNNMYKKIYYIFKTHNYLKLYVCPNDNITLYNYIKHNINLEDDNWIIIWNKQINLI